MSVGTQSRLELATGEASRGLAERFSRRSFVGRVGRAALVGTLGSSAAGALLTDQALAHSSRNKRRFEDAFFRGELNRFVGSGGEALLKRAGDNNSSNTLEVGDRLLGIGITHVIETLDRPPGPGAFRCLDKQTPFKRKIAIRGLEATRKQETASGFEYEFGPLPPRDLSRALEELSEGAVRISPTTIPRGTMVLSFIESEPGYTLRKIKGSPAANWAAAARGRRHWNVGVAKDDDFWRAAFPSDDLGLLREMPPQSRVGSISFGLSLLSGSRGMTDLELVPCQQPSGEETRHHFCLSGYAVGTRGLETPFPIGLRTEILFAPNAGS